MAPRGGYREGAGRKPLKTSERKVSLTVRVLPSDSAHLKRHAKEHKQSLSDSITAAIRKL